MLKFIVIFASYCVYMISIIMKRSSLFVCGMLAAVFAVASASDAVAQENANRDSLGRIVRGPYETNGAWDNWFIGVGGGINLFEDGWFGGNGYHQTRVAPALDVNIGKWWTPSVGFRVGYSGLRGNGWIAEPTVYASEFNEAKNMYKEKVNFAYIHGDIMWNISNAFSGYKETRFWNVSPYVSTGLLHGYGVSGVSAKNNQFALGVGIYNTMRLSDRVNLTLDARQLMFKGTFNGNAGGVASMSSITFGVAVNLGKTGWKRATVVPEGYAPYNIAEVKALRADSERYAKAVEKLAAANASLADENAALKDQMSDLEKAALEAAAAKRMTVTPGAVFFTIGQTELDEKELYHLDFYIKNVIEQDSDATFVLTGYADKDTGGKKRNQYLSEKRVEYVLNLLKTKYNVSEERLIIKAVGADTAFIEGKPLLNRCVVLEYAE